MNFTFHRRNIVRPTLRERENQKITEIFHEKLARHAARPPLARPRISKNTNETMSHFTTIKTQIKDINAVRWACQEMGLTLLQNNEARGYYEIKTKGEYVIRLKGPYDIALNKQPDGSFGITADLWNGHVEREVGQGYCKLLQLYGVHKTIDEARKKGHLISRRSLQQNGAIKLSISVA